MGSLSSRPAIPAAIAAPVVISAPISTPAPQAVIAPPDQSATTEASASQARTDNLLRRNRGRIGTIQTSFRGLLGRSNTATQRKTLLGE